MSSVAAVNLWGSTVGAVSVGDDGKSCFEWEPSFANSGIEPAPFHMPLSRSVYRFPELKRETFRGLPGALADLLPGTFGQTLMEAWLAFSDKKSAMTGVLDRLRFASGCGTGALKIEPVGPLDASRSESIDLAQIVPLVREVISRKHNLSPGFIHQRRRSQFENILQAGSATGGSQAKLLLAWNPDTGVFRTGAADAGLGFSDWLVKLDGVPANRFREREDPRDQGVVEFAYYLMARDCGIDMTECRLEEENNRRHFMTRRFDRRPDGSGLHLQTLGALLHIDWQIAANFSYEQAMLAPRRLGLRMDSTEQLFRRMVFNVVGCNRNDHANKIAFLMNKAGRWSLAPAYGLTFSYKPGNPWNGKHRMSINGKTDGFGLTDFRACARAVSIRRSLVKQCLDEVQSVFRRWPEYAAMAGLDDVSTRLIGNQHRTESL